MHELFQHKNQISPLNSNSVYVYCVAIEGGTFDIRFDIHYEIKIKILNNMSTPVGPIFNKSIHKKFKINFKPSNHVI